MPRVLLGVFVFLALASTGSRGFAQETPTSASDRPETPTAAIGAAVTPTPMASSSVTPSVEVPATPDPPASSRARLGARLFEDLNENGVQDSGDQVPAQTVAYLVPWSDTARPIEILTAGDGSFAFENLPPGDYTLRLFWPAGFASEGSSEQIPHLLRGIYRVAEDGSIVAPSPLPETWPGLPLEKFDPAADGTLLGVLPKEILVKPKEPGTSAVLPGTGEHVFATGVGTIDVGAVLGRLAAIDPPKEQADRGSNNTVVALGVILGAGAAAAAGVYAWRSTRHSDHT